MTRDERSAHHDPKYLVQKLVRIPRDKLHIMVASDDHEHFRLADDWFHVEDLPKGEPYFVLRGQDQLAEDTIRVYAGQRIAHEGLSVAVQQILAHADEFKAFERKKYPT